MKDGRYIKKSDDRDLRLHIDLNGHYPLKEAIYTEYRSGKLHEFWYGALSSVNGKFHVIVNEDSLVKVRKNEVRKYRKVTIEKDNDSIILKGKLNDQSFVERFDDFIEGFKDEFLLEFDREEGMEHVREIHTTEHIPNNHPNDIVPELLSIEKVLTRAGLPVKITANTHEDIKLDRKGWDNHELHTAMQDYWSKFKENPPWAAWSFIAKRHRNKRYSGIMFDFHEMGSQPMHGTAIFNKIIRDNALHSPGDKNSWQARMKFFVALHEIGHTFGLIHTHAHKDPRLKFQKSFMSFPSRSGGHVQFFKDFYYRFSNDELRTIRHEPPELKPLNRMTLLEEFSFCDSPSEVSNLILRLSIEQENGEFEYMEPVLVEYTLQNSSTEAIDITNYLSYDNDELALSFDSFHVFVRNKETNVTTTLRPLIHELVDIEIRYLNPGEVLSGSVFITLGDDGWIMQNPGSYDVQAMLHREEDDLISNKLMLQVRQPDNPEMEKLASAYFTHKMARVLMFDGYRHKKQFSVNTLLYAMGYRGNRNLEVNGVLSTISRKFDHTRLAIHANVALAMPLRESFKYLDFRRKTVYQLRSRKIRALKYFRKAFKAPDEAEITLGKTDFDYYYKIYRELESEVAARLARKMARWALVLSILACLLMLYYLFIR